MKKELKESLWILLVLLLLFSPFVALFTISEMKARGEVLVERDIIFQKVLPSREGQAMIAYPDADRLLFSDDRYDFLFDLSRAPKVLQDLALHKISLSRPRIKREEIIPCAPWPFRSCQKILVYPELEIVALVEGDYIIGHWRLAEAPEVLKKFIRAKGEIEK